MYMAALCGGGGAEEGKEEGACVACGGSNNGAFNGGCGGRAPIAIIGVPWSVGGWGIFGCGGGGP
jgi:hypothetical protein